MTFSGNWKCLKHRFPATEKQMKMSDILIKTLLEHTTFTDPFSIEAGVVQCST